jgi:tetratricopeptide (TPR) repeat protein
MGLFPGRAAYDRARILDAAARARAKRQRLRAIELYRQVLSHEPQNTELHAKLAPLLAETGQPFDAWCSFKSVARSCLREGHPDKALAVYREATLFLPREPQAWQAVAQIQHKHGRAREAVETLLEGSRQFRTRWLRPQAIHLLRKARDVAPWEFEVVLELARLLAVSGQRHEARFLLEGLARRSQGERLRRVRAVQLRLAPGPAAFWRWVEAALERPPGAGADLAAPAPDPYAAAAARLAPEAWPAAERPAPEPHAAAPGRPAPALRPAPDPRPPAGVVPLRAARR